MSAHTLPGEAKFAFRRLWRSPFFTIFATLSLAIGIGVSTATFSILYTQFWRPLGVSDTRGLVFLTEGSSNPIRTPTVSWSDVVALDEQHSVLQSRAVWTRFPAALVGDGTSRLLGFEAVSGEYFRLLGVHGALGRMIEPADDDAAAPPVVVLSDLVWRSQFGARPSIIGTIVKCAGQQVTVVGVAPAGFAGLSRPLARSQGAWVPLAFTAHVEQTSRRRLVPGQAQEPSLHLVARLQTGTSLRAAQSEVESLGARLNQADPFLAADSLRTSTQAVVTRTFFEPVWTI